MRTALLLALFYAPLVFSEAPAAPDIPSTTEAPTAVSQGNWTGYYAGVVSGAQFGSSSDTTGALGYNADNQTWNYATSGLNVAAQIGYATLWKGLIVGPEFEMGYLGLNGSGAQPGSPGSDTVGSSSGDFHAALRARVGMDLNRSLIFATAGLMVVNRQMQVVDACAVAPCGGSTVSAVSKALAPGFTMGAGIEHSFWENFSVKLEYLYLLLGSGSFSGTTNLGNTYQWSGSSSGDVLRLGFNYHFE
ncbi:outer membrane beta-barrel protein [bacterium]|nr:outer membrane beta-barrel protein [bacterium]